MTKSEFDFILDKAGNGYVDEIIRLAMICYKMAEGAMEHNINKAMEYMELGNGWERASDGTYSLDLYEKLKELTSDCFKDSFVSSISSEVLYKIEQALVHFEVELFTGSFSESFIRNDLQLRSARDRYSTLGSREAQTGIKEDPEFDSDGVRIPPHKQTLLHLKEKGFQTHEFSNKKDFYLDSFDKDLELINICLSYSPPTSYVNRLERCRNQVTKLIDIVRNYKQ